MILVIGIFSLGHVFFFLILSWKWSRIKLYGDGKKTTFSVVIPVRNEEENIKNVLSDLENQSFDKNQFEVIVVDDFSTDHTKKIALEISENTSLDLQILSLENPTIHGKKNALTKGIEASKHDVILTTDADCRIDEKWIEAYAYAFSPETQIVAGPVALEGQGMFAKMQMAEFAGLIAFGGVTLASNNPSMCSGANLAFRKEAFEEVGGYQGNIQIPSGDDEFLLYDIIKKYPRSGRFLKSTHGTVKTTTQPTFEKFRNQRSRWISKWKYNKNWKLRLTAVLLFIDYLLFIIAIGGTIFGYFPFIFLGVIFTSRLLTNYLLLKQVSNFLNHKSVFRPLLLLQILYPFHVLIMGLQSIFGGYTWKGRKYG